MKYYAKLYFWSGTQITTDSFNSKEELIDHVKSAFDWDELDLAKCRIIDKRTVTKTLVEDYDAKKSIMNDIMRKGYFIFIPNLWFTHGSALMELRKNGEIEPLGNVVHMNGDYIYIKKGNPDKVGPVRISDTDTCLQKNA